MAVLKETDVELKLFTDTDPYYFVVDNRPLREIQTNILAMNDQIEDVVESDCEVASFVVESPSVESEVGGRYVMREDGTIVRVVLSFSAGGSGGNLEADVFIDGTTVFTTPANRPILAFDAAQEWVERVGANLQNKEVQAGDVITCDFLEVPTGTPRWARVEVFIRKTQDENDSGDPYDATQYTGGG